MGVTCMTNVKLPILLRVTAHLGYKKWPPTWDLWVDRQARDLYESERCLCFFFFRMPKFMILFSQLPDSFSFDRELFLTSPSDRPLKYPVSMYPYMHMDDWSDVIDQVIAVVPMSGMLVAYFSLSV
jgi:hypothetical protein